MAQLFYQIVGIFGFAVPGLIIAIVVSYILVKLVRRK